MAVTLRTGDTPFYLTEDQLEIYSMQIEDKAYVQEEKAVNAFKLALDKSYELTLYNDNTAYATRRRLGELRPDEFPGPVGATARAALDLFEVRQAVRVRDEPVGEDGSDAHDLTLDAGCWLSALALTGCPRSGKPTSYSEEELATNPAANFQSGLSLLQNPDQARPGAVDYETAFQRFNASANLGGGPQGPRSTPGGPPSSSAGPPTPRCTTERPTRPIGSYEAAMFSLARMLNEQGKDMPRPWPCTPPTPRTTPTISRPATISSRPSIRAGEHDKALAEAQDILR